jgi:hypothetical protein
LGPWSPLAVYYSRFVALAGEGVGEAARGVVVLEHQHPLGGALAAVAAEPVKAVRFLRSV